jgi:hypothetical protein
VTSQSRGRVHVAIASIRDHLRVRTTRLPDIAKWLEEKAGRPIYWSDLAQIDVAGLQLLL